MAYGGKPKRSTEGKAWSPFPRQKVFINSKCFETLYGGAAGGGKTDAIIMSALRYVKEPTYNACMIRNTHKELIESVYPRMVDLYSRYYPDLHWDGQNKVFTFPSGAQIWLKYCACDQDSMQYRGFEYQFIGFEELTLFKRSWYLRITSRLRGTNGVPQRIMATTNPGGLYPEWVMEHWGPWIHPRSEYKAKTDEVLWFSPRNEIIFGQPGRLDTDRTFIFAKLSDNPALYEDGNYERNLMRLDDEEREQLLNGIWIVTKRSDIFSHFTDDRILYDHRSKADSDLVGYIPVIGEESDILSPSGLPVIHYRQWRNVRYAIGMDHGELAGHQVIVLVAYSETEKKACIVDEWSSDCSVTEEEIAEQIKSLLSFHELEPDDISIWIGDINTGGVASRNTKINKTLGKLLGVRVDDADKSGGSVDRGIKEMNGHFREKVLFVYDGCDEIKRALRFWDDTHKTKQYLHILDAARYVLMEVFKRLGVRKFKSGKPTSERKIGTIDYSSVSGRY